MAISEPARSPPCQFGDEPEVILQGLLHGVEVARVLNLHI
jgi:hypothetical protein